jgi:hypothetical protein
MPFLPAETTAPIPAYIGNSFGLSINLAGGDFRASTFEAKLVDPAGYTRELTIALGTITSTNAQLSISATATQTEYWREGDHWLEFNIGLETYLRAVVSVYGLKSEDSPVDFSEINLSVVVNEVAIALTISGAIGGGAIGQAVYAANTIAQARVALRIFTGTSLPPSGELGDLFFLITN